MDAKLHELVHLLHELQREEDNQKGSHQRKKELFDKIQEAVEDIYKRKSKNKFKG